jgi:hypothetical protein
MWDRSTLRNSATPQLVSIDLVDIVRTARVFSVGETCAGNNLSALLPARFAAALYISRPRQTWLTAIRGEQDSTMPGRHAASEELLSVFEISHCELEEE